MKSLRIYISLIFILAGFPSVAQTEFKLKGVLFENGSSLRLALATVSNYRTKVSVGTNDMGYFEMYAQVGDTLLVGKRGFAQQEIVLKNTNDLIVKLNRDILLNGVTVYGQSNKAALEEMQQDFKNKGVFYGGKRNPLLLLPFGGHPLTFLYNLFGRAPKQARRLNRLYNSEVQQGQIDVYFNRTLIHERTGLTGAALDDFMVNYRPDYNQAKQWVLYDYTKWINDSFKQYQDSLKK